MQQTICDLKSYYVTLCWRILICVLGQISYKSKQNIYISMILDLQTLPY